MDYETVAADIARRDALDQGREDSPLTESEDAVTVDTSDPEFRRRLQQVTAGHETALQEKLKRAGVDLFTVSTEEDLVRAIIRLAALRKRRRRASSTAR